MQARSALGFLPGCARHDGDNGLAHGFTRMSRPGQPRRLLADRAAAVAARMRWQDGAA
jgi:hypothetical protein